MRGDVVETALGATVTNSGNLGHATFRAVVSRGRKNGFSKQNRRPDGKEGGVSNRACGTASLAACAFRGASRR